MKLAKYWHKAQERTRDINGTEFNLSCYGISSVSLTEAKRSAQEKLDALVTKLVRGESLRDYEYQMQEIREELIRELPKGSEAPWGAITRNRYGAIVLNAASILIADVDYREPGTFEKLLGWLGGTVRDREYYLARFEEVAHQEQGRSLLVYETCAGFRVFLTSTPCDPKSQESVDLLHALGSDPIYRKLCLNQACYRARLSPKPWRIGIHGGPPGRYPREDEAQENAFFAWVAEYERKSFQFAVCRVIGYYGSGHICAEAKELLEVHDEFVLSDTSEELA